MNKKINRLINNRNLKEYSCFIGVKQIVEADMVYLTHKAQILNIQFEVNGVFTYTSVSIQINTEEISGRYISGFFTAINKKNTSDGGQVIMLREKVIDKQEIEKILSEIIIK